MTRTLRRRAQIARSGSDKENRQNANTQKKLNRFFAWAQNDKDCHVILSRVGCGEFLNCYMTEIDGGLGAVGKKSGYAVYRLDAPPAPELKVDKNAVKFKLPEKSGAAEAGYIDGYRLSFRSEDGKLSELLYPIGDSGKNKSLSLSELVKKMPEGGKKASVRLSVSICEYIEGKGSEKCFGP